MRRYTEVDERVYQAAMRYRDSARELLDPSLRDNGYLPSPVAQRAATVGAGADAQHDLRRIVAKSLGVADDVISDTSSLRDIGVNSLDLVVLVMSIEETYHIEFDPSDLERLKTFGDLARRVTELKGER